MGFYRIAKTNMVVTMLINFYSGHNLEGAHGFGNSVFVRKKIQSKYLSQKISIIMQSGTLQKGRVFMTLRTQYFAFITCHAASGTCSSHDKVLRLMPIPNKPSRIGSNSQYILACLI